jgi:phage recombination protein Bet
MTKAVAVKKEEKKPAPYTQDQIDLIKRTVAKDATNDELKLFLIVAARSGLDPFSRQIHFVKRKGQGTFQTGIDGYRAIAERTRTLAGIDDPIYDDEKGAHPNKATVTVYRMIEGHRVPFTASARWSEYVPPKGQDFMWQKMPYLMLGKVAEALALRKAFPNDLSGLYTHEEMAQADQEPATTQPAMIEQPTEPVALSNIALDFIAFLEGTATIEEYNDVYKTIIEAKESGAITKEEYREIVVVAKKTVARLQAKKKQQPAAEVVDAEVVQQGEETEPMTGYEKAKAAAAKSRIPKF